MTLKHVGDEKKQEILQLRRKGLSLRKIAKRIGCSAPTVQRICDPAAYERANACNRRCYAKHRKKRLVKANQYRESHREKYCALAQEYREDHHEEIKKYREDHRVAYRSYALSYCQRHKAEIAARVTAYYRTHKAEIAARKAVWYQMHKAGARARNAKYRALKRGSLIGSDAKAMKAVYARAANPNPVRCYLCGKVIPQSERHVDHVIPLSRGGAHVSSNLAIACAMCNLSKNDRTSQEYRQYQLEAVAA